MDIPLPTRSDFIDITNHSFGRLFVDSYAGGHKWNCKCECGSAKVVRGINLRSGNTESCGCLKRETMVKRNTTHGMYGTTEYSSYQQMRKRCYYKEDISYHNYGGRGITVCDRWLESFEDFYSDMGDKPSHQHSLDRIDNEGNYSPSNCKWSTKSEQALNQRVRKDNSSGVAGVAWCKSTEKWKAYFTINAKRAHLGYFDNKQDAIDARAEAEIAYYEGAK